MRWQHAPRALAPLSGGNVHVWQARVDVPAATLARLEELLAPDEKRRAERFVFPRDRWRFVARRGALRLILSRYVESAPESLCFQADSYGRPLLVAPRRQRLSFSASHSRGVALVAFGADVDVGVDVERVRDGLAFLEIAARFFAPEEVAALNALSPGERAEAFFNAWTRKEALLKGCGMGLALPLDTFVVSLTSGAPLTVRGTSTPLARGWQLLELPVEAGWKAALAVRGAIASIELFATGEL